MTKEKDAISQRRLEEVRLELAALDDALRPLQARYNAEKARLDEVWLPGRTPTCVCAFSA